MNIDEMWAQEQRRLIRLLRKATSREWVELNRPAIKNLALMSAQLECQATKLADESLALVEEYDNGGGQTGKRESPEYKAYEALYRTYQSGMKHLLSAMPKAEAEKAADQPKSMLAIIQGKKRFG